MRGVSELAMAGVLCLTGCYENVDGTVDSALRGDAMVADTGVLDARSSDASPDAAPADAGGDANSADAASRDAGLLDGGPDGGGDPACTEAAVQALLSAASPGDTVDLPACCITGAFTVPAGVTARGAGRGATVLISLPGTAAVTLLPGAPASALQAVSIESDGTAGVFADGAGEVTVEDVTIDATRGYGMHLVNLTRANLSSVALTGAVTPATAATWLNPTPADTATHGLYAECVEEVVATDVRALGFALFGGIVMGGDLQWTRGGAPTNLGTGLFLVGTRAILEDLDFSGTLQGSRLFPAYSVFADGGTLATARLVISDSEGYGLVMNGSSAVHRDLVAERNNVAAVYAASASLELLGGTFRDNRGGGVVAVGTSSLQIVDTVVATTTLLVRIVGSAPVEIGDGIQVRAPLGPLELRDLVLMDNARAGAVIDLGGGDFGSSVIEGVTVSGVGAQLGMILQNGTFPAGWDAGVVRLGATAVNDAAHTGTLPRLGTFVSSMPSSPCP